MRKVRDVFPCLLRFTREEGAAEPMNGRQTGVENENASLNCKQRD